MDIIKYFYEEPFHLEDLADDLDFDARRQELPTLPLNDFVRVPSYYRGYLAGTNLRENIVGLTAVSDKEAFIDGLKRATKDQIWTHISAQSQQNGLTHTDLGDALSNPDSTGVLVVSNHVLGPKDIPPELNRERRESMAALRGVLQHAVMVMFPEPAHHGNDWSIFSSKPIRKRLEQAIVESKAPETRFYSLPYQHARSEHKFYFEQYSLEEYSAFEVKQGA